MKHFILLFKREMNLHLRASLFFFACAGCIPPLYFFFFADTPSQYAALPFETMFTSSPLPVILTLLAVLSYVWSVRSVLHDLAHCRECFLSLPCRRPLWFFSKTASVLVLMLWLWAGQLCGILLSYAVFVRRAIPADGIYPVANGLVIGICRSRLLHLLVPLGIPCAVSFLLLFGGVCLSVVPLAFSLSRRRLWDMLPLFLSFLMWAFALYTAGAQNVGSSAVMLSHVLLFLSLILLTLHSLYRLNRSDL